ncbi:phage integrase SAM-like domain-containing protein [Spirosoma litoris]
MRVLFIKRNSRKSQSVKATIYCRIKIDGIPANDFSTYIKVESSEWDSEKQRIKGKSLRANDDNSKLSLIQSDITRLFLQFESANEPVSAQHLADLYTNKQKRTHTFWELVDLFEQHIAATYKNKGTRRNYQTRIDNIKLFLEEKKWKKLAADRFTLGSADEFVRWARKRNLDNNYIVRHTQVLKNITEDAVRREILKLDKLAAFVLKKKEKVNIDHLTRSEINDIATFDWRPEIRRIVDLFLFSVYTGLHYEDAQTLTPNDVRKGVDGRIWLFKVRGKYAESDFFVNESVQVVPLSAPALALIEKYKGVENLA